MYISLYTIINNKGSHVYKLSLPLYMHLYPMVYISLFKPYYIHNNTDMNINMKDKLLYTIDKIINS